MAWSIFVTALAVALLSSHATAQATTQATPTTLAPRAVVTSISVVVDPIDVGGPKISIQGTSGTSTYTVSYGPPGTNYIHHFMPEMPEVRISGFHLYGRALYDFEKLVFYGDDKVELVNYSAGNVSLGDGVSPVPFKGAKYFSVLWTENQLPSILTMPTSYGSDLRRRAKSTEFVGATETATVPL